jgi:exodeoxyribonuclease VII large subunit
LCGRLDALSPLAVLSRGYAIVKQHETKAVVQSVRQVNHDDSVEISLADGQIMATVTRIDSKGVK